MSIAIFIIVVLIVMALLLYAVQLLPLPPDAALPEGHPAGADRRPGRAPDAEPRNGLLRGVVMRAAILLAVVLQLSGCASVVIIQRSVPTLADQWRAGTMSGTTTVTVPKDARQPIAVRDK